MYQRCLSSLITTIIRTVNATPATTKKNLSLYSPCKRLNIRLNVRLKTRTSEANTALGLDVTHSQGDMAHYDSPFAEGWEHERQSWGVGGGVCEEERQLTPNGGKMAISNQVPSAAQFATGQNTSVIRFLLTIFPNHCSQCCPTATDARTMSGVFRAALVARLPCHPTSSIFN